MKFMYKEQLDNLSQGIYTCTPEHLEKLKEQIGRYFTFVKNQVQAGIKPAGYGGSGSASPALPPQSPDGAATTFIKNQITQEDLKLPPNRRNISSDIRANPTSALSAISAISVQPGATPATILGQTPSAPPSAISVKVESPAVQNLPIKEEVKDPLEYAISSVAALKGSKSVNSPTPNTKLGAKDKLPPNKPTPNTILETPRPFLDKSGDPLTPPDTVKVPIELDIAMQDVLDAGGLGEIKELEMGEASLPSPLDNDYVLSSWDPFGLNASTELADNRWEAEAGVSIAVV